MKILLCLALGVLGAASTAMAGDTAPVACKSTPDGLELWAGDTAAVNYVHRGVPFKPYIRSLTTPSGIQVLRDAPFDHLHHHALMYALGADDVSYWEETPKGGKQFHQSIQTMTSPAGDANPWAGFVETLDWVPPHASKAVLNETRTVVLHATAPEMRLLTWETRLKPAADKAVVLGGSHYYGLGMRFVQGMDKGGKFINPTGQPGELVRGDEHNAPAPWCAYQATLDGKPVTVAMFDHPGNTRPAVWFTMGDNGGAFAYLSATINLYKEKLTLEAGKTLVARYGVALFDGHAPNEKIEAAAQWWKEHTPAP